MRFLNNKEKGSKKEQKNEKIHIKCRKMQKMKIKEKTSKKEQKSEIKHKTMNKINSN